jgi:monofunctional biosynthetic peptidoglycan transglycosylase
MPAVRSRFRRLAKFVLKIACVVVVLSVGLVLLLRFIPPPVSAFMVERGIESWWNGNDAYHSRYEWVRLDQIAPVMAAAVVAAEDQNFPVHFGFDLKAIEEAVAYNQQSTRIRGASTISQQTARNLFLWSGRTWLRKGMEAWFTLLLEVLWPKRRILETYLNIAEFGDGIYGVETASREYFGKPASRLTASEAALLAAVLPSPRRYSVRRPGPYVRTRHGWILQQMRQLGGPALVNSLK